ncbi:capsular polysaccharide synthesis protein [Yoonia sp. 2307UL14-13]|uniref:capsular polysaccharide synthesis protein n=1 Tax=Yoonia sp. 2307UL14-13 TaxID=3126506 RepID=UPI003095311F
MSRVTSLAHRPKLARRSNDDTVPPTCRAVSTFFWDTGFETAPDIVKLCAQSWLRFHPDWDVVLLDQTQADEILPRDGFPAEMIISHYADMLRTALLLKHGGVWADATCLCLKPLDGWLPNIFNQCGFFAFHKPGPDRLISSWFLAAAKNSVVVEEMHAIFGAYWKWGPHHAGKPPYFWFHYLFEHLVQDNRDVRARWSHAPKISAVPVHQLKRLLSGTIDDTARIRAMIGATPVQKLTHKQDIKVDDILEILDQVGITL